ncbi:MAG TPA: biotin transporter BioY [Bacteroidota bacterium]|nr:biotin transporter BioY [Bacteroidota bacterium]
MREIKTISLSHIVALRSERVAAQAFWIFTFAILTAIGAQIEIPHQPVPFTLQTLFVLLAGGLLGRRNGFLSMSAYLCMGALGLPVFAGGLTGFARLVGPTGGYLLGFPVAAFVIGSMLSTMPSWIARMNGKTLKAGLVFGWGLISMGAGLVLIFLLGTVQLNALYFHNWNSSFGSGFLIFSWWDLAKLLVAAGIWKELGKF